MKHQKLRIEVPDAPMGAIMRSKTPAEKIGMIAAAHRTARRLATAGVRYQHPEWEEEQIQMEAVRRVSRGTR